MASILLFRTRISIKYAPKMLTLVNLAYLSYLESYITPAALEATLACLFFQVVIICHFTIYYEIKGLHTNVTHNPFVPTDVNPRLAYIPIDVGSYHILPPLWSLVYPPSFLQSFNSDDRKYLLDGTNMPYNFALHE